ncbi:MAG: efflux RND transporter periplasmic adaptor subunit [Halofilum sp. (in: g-proteobacteria)]|nr:efflux RND transporter periplasmic adaptor subunit [Halofilum sp. (in: g-proteobacteria)]
MSYKTQQFFANQSAPVQTVTATRAEASTWQPRISSVGNLSAVSGSDLASEIAGKVTDVAVADGAQVDAGDVLVRLDSVGLEYALRGAQAETRLAEIELERQRRLRSQQANSEADVDRAESELAQARAEVGQIQAELDKKTIRAPFAGRIGIVEVDVGQFVDVGTPIVTLQTLDPVLVDFTVPQRDLGRIETGRPMVARADAWPGREFPGEVTAISPKVERRTRSVDVRAQMGNPDKVLRPGMFVDVQVLLPQQEDVITLPQTAVSYNPYGDSVFLIHESETDSGETELTVERKFVQTGATRGDQIAIVDGVEVGDRVVTSGQLKLRNGSKVKIDNSVTPSNDPDPQVGNR